jgi:hypothetical protein
LNMPNAVEDINVVGSVVRLENVNEFVEEEVEDNTVLGVESEVLGEVSSNFLYNCIESGGSYDPGEKICVCPNGKRLDGLSEEDNGNCPEEEEEIEENSVCQSVGQTKISSGICYKCEYRTAPPRWYAVDMAVCDEGGDEEDETEENIPEELQDEKCCGNAICGDDEPYCGGDNYCSASEVGEGPAGICENYANSDDPRETIRDLTCTEFIDVCGACYRIAGTWADGSTKYQECDQNRCNYPSYCYGDFPDPEDPETTDTCAGGGTYLESCVKFEGACRQCGWGIVNRNQYGVKWIDAPDTDMCEGHPDNNTPVFNCKDIGKGEPCNCPEGVESESGCVFDDKLRCVPKGGGDPGGPEEPGKGDSCNCDDAEGDKPAGSVSCVYDGLGFCRYVNDNCPINRYNGTTFESITGTWDANGDCIEEGDTKKDPACEGKGINDDCTPSGTVSDISIGQLVCVQTNTVSAYQCKRVGDVCKIAFDLSGRVHKIFGDGKCKQTEECANENYELKDNGVCGPKDGEDDEDYNDRLCWESAGVKLVKYDSEGQPYDCKWGKWVKANYTDGYAYYCMKFLEGEVDSVGCYHNNAYCYQEESGKLYKCVGNEWTQNYDSGENEEEYATELKEINSGEQCSGDRPCKCNGGYDKLIGVRQVGEWCRDVRSGMSGGISVCLESPSHTPEVGDVCNFITGATCTDEWTPSGYRHCDGDSSSTSINNFEKPLISLLPNSKVLAQTTANEQYIIDQQTGIFENIPTGSYIFEYQGKSYNFTVLSSGGTLIYLDLNDNGEYDEGTDTKISDIAMEVSIIPIEQSFTYELIEGYNFVSFPFLIRSTEAQTAASLLKKLNEIYGNTIYSISKYENGGWKMVGQNVEVYASNDFNILPGEGYVIKAKESGYITIVGQPIQFESAGDSAPVNLIEGWNLVGLYGTNVKSYTASSLLDDINSANFESDNVTRWANEKQLYEGFMSDNGEYYGTDFRVNRLESIFIRINQGRGNWEPALGY